MNQHPNDPLHGLTLETLLNRLVEKYGWEVLGQKIRIRCFTNDPSISSSLRFLRKTPWAREKVEKLYLCMQGDSPLRDKSPSNLIRPVPPGTVPL